MREEEVREAVKRLMAMDVLRIVDDELYVLDEGFRREVFRALAEVESSEDALAEAVVLALVRWRMKVMGEGYPEDEILTDASVVFAFLEKG